MGCKKFLSFRRAASDQVILESFIQEPTVLKKVLVFLEERRVVLNQCSLPILTYSVHRFAALRNLGYPWLKWVRALDDFCILTVEQAFLPGGKCHALLRQECPEGAAVQYQYGSHGAFRHTRVDPRIKVGAVLVRESVKILLSRKIGRPL